MKRINKLLCLLLALAICISLLPSNFAWAESVTGEEENIPGTLTVETRSRSYTFNVGDEFTYSFWLHLVPDVANYAASYVNSISEYTQYLEDSNVQWLQGYVSYNDDYLELLDYELPNISSTKNTIRNIASGSSESALVSSLLGMTSAVYFNATNFTEDESTQFNMQNMILVTCKFKVRHEEEKSVGPVVVRTKLKQIKVQNDELISVDNPSGTFLVVDDGNPRVPYESYETVTCAAKNIDEQPEIILKSLVDDIALDVRCELANQILGGEEAMMRPGKGVKVTIIGAASDVRGYRQVRYTNGESLVWFFDVPSGMYYARCSYVSDTGARYGTKDFAHAEVIAVPDTGTAQALWLFLEDSSEITDIPVYVHWRNDKGYLPIRPADVVLRLIDPLYPAYSEAVVYVDTNENAEDQFDMEYSFDYVPIYYEENNGTKRWIDYDLVVADLPKDSLYSYYVEKTVDEETKAISFDVTLTYIGPDAKLNKITPDSAGHYWVLQEANKHATCTTPERLYYVCDVCHGTKYVKGQDALGHLWTTDEEDTSEGWKVIQEQSCTEDEIQKRVCLRDDCGYTEEKHTKQATGHEWGEYVPDYNSTCEKMGTKTAACIHDGCTATDVKDNPEDPAKQHKWSEASLKSAATCETNELWIKHCENVGCGESVEFYKENTATGHDWEQEGFDGWTTKSDETCTADKVETATCHCGETKDRTIEDTATGHDWEQEGFDGWTLKSAETCTADRVMTYTCHCGETKNITIEDTATGHDWGDNEESGWITSQPETCTTPRYETRTCHCGYSENRHDRVAATGHDWEQANYSGWTTKQAETCTTDRIEKAVCHCGQTNERTIENTKTGHLFLDYVSDGNATCSADGTKTAKCAHAGCTEKQTVTDEGSKNSVAHVYGEYISNNDATVDTDGTVTRTCLKCGHEDTVTDINSALHHIYTDESYVYNNDARCEVNGTETAVCQEPGCGAQRTRTAEGTALKHDWSDYTYNNDHTCTSDGTSTCHCLREGCSATATKPELGTKQHTWGEWNTVTPPTCTEKGLKRSNCEKCTVYKDEYIDATGHSWGKWIVTGKPTCTQSGWETRYCSVNGCKGEETREVDALGHNYVSGYCTGCGQPDPNYQAGYHVVLSDAQLHGGKEVYVDGVRYLADAENCIVLTSPDCKLLTVYEYNTVSEDAHNVYPKNMYVYSMKLYNKTYVITELTNLANILQYKGCSIRFVGEKGIRMITGIPKSTRTNLINSTVNGYSLAEYGTLVGFDDKIGTGDVIIGAKNVTKVAAYQKESGKDPIYKDDGTLIQFTNVLTGIKEEYCSRDLAMRPYMILKDSSGNEVVLYGGIIHRSIGYIAYQNRNAFTAGTSEYNYIWGIIHSVYGTAYDSEYRG